MNRSERQKAIEKRELFRKYGQPVPKLAEDLGPRSRLPEVACFAFDIEVGCKVLDQTYCQHEKCDFYKSEEQYQKEKERYGCKN